MQFGSLFAALAAATPEAAAQAPVVAASTEGVTRYPADFFAERQPLSAYDMVVRVPGFTFDGGDSVRGFGGAAGNVLIGGQRPATKSESLEDALRRIQASQVDRVEIIVGGAPGIDMQGKNVVANVVLRADAKGSTLLAVASSFQQDGRTTPAMRFEGSRQYGVNAFDWSLLSYRYVDDGAGEGPRVVRRADGSVSPSWLDETGGGDGLTAKANLKRPLLGGRLSLNTVYEHEVYDWSLEDIPQAGPQAGGDRLKVIDADDREEGEVGLGWEKALTARSRVELTGLVRRKHVDYASTFTDAAESGRFTSARDSGESIARGVLRHTLSPTLSFEGGGEIAVNFLESQIGYLVNGAPQVLPAANVRVEEKRGEAFGVATWRVHAKLTLEGALRLERSTISQTGDTNLEKSFTYPKPRLSATWSPTAHDQFRGRVEREVGQLDFSDFVSSTTFSTGRDTAGGAELVPERAWVFEAAWERKFGKDGAVVLTGRHKEISDVADRILVVDEAGGLYDAPGNIGDAVSDELELSVNLPLERLVPGGLLRGKGTWTRSKVVDPITGRERRISDQEPFEGELRFSQDLPKRKLQWGVELFSAEVETSYAFNEVSRFEIEPWLMAYAEVKPRQGLSLRVEAQNLTGRGLNRRREVFEGRVRAPGDFAYLDDRRVDFDPFIYFRLRQTWG
jgi:outer membrane receptor protein involved in Fe transport